MKLELKDLHDLARGAAFLGTGGGGDPYIGRLLLQQEMAVGRIPNIIDIDSIDDEALVAPVACMGAPTVMVERFPKIASIEKALKVLEKSLGRKLDALLCAEAGGVNCTLPLIAAARTGLPIIDADGMGRAFPELQMVTFNIYGCSASPVVMVDDYGSSIVIDTEGDNKKAEQYARTAVMAMRGSAQIALFPMTGAQVKKAAIRGSLSLAVDIGRAIGAAHRDRRDPVEALLDHFRARSDHRFCKVLFTGKIVDVVRETRGGFAFGRAVLEGTGKQGGRCEIDFQNENLLARHDDRIVAMVPDLISLVDAETAEPITTEGLKYGQRVKAIGVSVPPVMRTPEALAVFGPRAFGYSVDFVPIEAIL